MALTDEQLALVKQVRLNTDEPNSEKYDDDILWAVIQQAEGDTRIASAVIWEQKAAGYATLVDESESGSSHSFSQLQRNAMTMATHYGKRSEAEVAEDVPAPTSRKAVRR